MSKWLFSLVFCLFVTGCSTYYRVSDVGSGKVYYTHEVLRRANGAVEFSDARTGAVVTIQSSEVLEVGSAEFERGIEAPRADEGQ